jgi:hypothetical protein
MPYEKLDDRVLEYMKREEDVTLERGNPEYTFNERLLISRAYRAGYMQGSRDLAAKISEEAI